MPQESPARGNGGFCSKVRIFPPCALSSPGSRRLVIGAFVGSSPELVGYYGGLVVFVSIYFNSFSFADRYSWIFEVELMSFVPQNMREEGRIDEEWLLIFSVGDAADNSCSTNL